MSILNTFTKDRELYFNFDDKEIQDIDSNKVHTIEFATDHKKRSDDEIYFWIDNEKFTYSEIEKSQMYSNYKHEVLLKFDTEIEEQEEYERNFHQPDMMDSFKNKKENY